MPRYTPENAHRLGVISIFLDGERVSDACEVDDDLGFVVVRDRSTPLGRRLLTGQVVVTFAPSEVSKP